MHSDGLEVSEFLEGYRACTNADFGDPDIQSDVLALYRRVHSGPRLQQTKTIFDMIEEHIEQGRELGSAFPVDMPWLEHRYGQAKAAFMASGLDIVPCFNDPMPGNFLISAEPSSAEADAAHRLRIRLQQRAQLRARRAVRRDVLRRTADRAAGRAISRRAPPLDGGAGRHQPRARRSQMGVVGGGQPQAQGLGLRLPEIRRMEIHARARHHVRSRAGRAGCGWSEPQGVAKVLAIAAVASACSMSAGVAAATTRPSERRRERLAVPVADQPARAFDHRQSAP